MLDVIGVKSIVIRDPVSEFDVDGREPRLHQFQVHKQSACPSVSVDKGMDALNPDFAALTVTYTVAAIASLILYFVLNKGGHLLREYSYLNWAPFVLGIVIIGLEVGFIYAYKAG